MFWYSAFTRANTYFCVARLPKVSLELVKKPDLGPQRARFAHHIGFCMTLHDIVEPRVELSLSLLQGLGLSRTIVQQSRAPDKKHPFWIYVRAGTGRQVQFDWHLRFRESNSRRSTRRRMPANWVPGTCKTLRMSVTPPWRFSTSSRVLPNTYLFGSKGVRFKMFLGIQRCIDLFNCVDYIDSKTNTCMWIPATESKK